MSLVPFALRRMIGRRGSFFGAMAFVLLIAVLASLLVVDGQHTERVWVSAIGTPLVIAMTIVAALEGSYDVSQGTMRYLVLTGVPRWQLVLVRTAAVVLATLLVALPALLVGGFVMAGDGRTGAEIARALGGALVQGTTWAIVAMAVGTLLRSNGAGIAIAIVFYLMATPITYLLYLKVSETLANYLLPNVAGIVSKFGTAQPDDLTGNPIAYGAAVVALLAWLTGAVAVAMWRVRRDEY